MIPKLKYPWNQPHFPRFQAQLNLIHQKEKKTQRQTNQKENKIKQRCIMSIVIVWRGREEEFTVVKLGIREMEVESVMIALR